ncbi:ABC transporter ATP-binding protein [Consotaella salsifontis]|uniref:Carbohydrate ABC transporter ATP-binding protein, CUT1 family n=1 Tax=Consotaella salsifontis TaxID=1365950 RepID=A0A1T4SGA0_9HYPH|nr:ABC transporter ATP-binding protein [Consotaella salsifontis]SKA27209.1 carbohydrate ABC transporter ATP-binding protein, CUT1 family [Consotaella salsifontis]
MSFLEISSATKSYGRHKVLEDVNLTIERGEFVVFVGPSGCGKSTLLRMITGLETITSGTISIEGAVMNDVDPAKRGTAMVFQSYALYPHMTVFENISFGLRMARKPKEYIASQVAQGAGILQLEKLLERRPGQLSGGQKQRVAIGRAIVRDPRVFLFDEPLSNLDAELRVQMRAELMDLHRRLGTTMIYVTHDQVEAMTLADKMVVMNGGRVQQAGRPLTLYDDPDNRFVAGFVGSPKMNFLPARVVGSDMGRILLEGIGGSARLSLPFAGELAVGTSVEIGLRPEHVSLRPLLPTESSEALVGEGKVAYVEDLGAESHVHLTLTDGTAVCLRAARGEASPGTTVRFFASPERALLFDAGGLRLRNRSARTK